jgi:hypothetical protein
MPSAHTTAARGARMRVLLLDLIGIPVAVLIPPW